MLFLSGSCCILAILSFLTKSMPKKRRLYLISIQLGAAILLMMDRYAYIFRGDLSQFGWWAVRISNFMVFFLSLFLIYFFDLYLIDLYLREGNLPKAPKRLYAVGIFLALGTVLLVVNQFTGLYYAFDECNRYYRNKWFPVCYIIPYICLLMQFSVIVQYRSRLRPLVWIPIILFDLGPILSIVVQFFAYGISLQNLTVVGLVILLYIFVIVDMNKTVEQANKLKFELMEQEQHKMHTLFEQTAEALATAIDAKDKYTHGHSTRVAEYSKQIAILAGKSKEECDEIYYAGLLHDIGKIGVPRNIINKEGRLTDEEFAEIKKHPVMGNQILSSIGESPYLSIGAHYHHERYDGRGYPEGLKGTDIPDIARIIAVADAYDAMTSKRSYRDPIPQQKVREEIVKGMDSQFDPQYAKLMLHLIDLDSEYKMKEQQEVRELAGKNELNCTGFRQEKSEGIVVSDSVTKIHLRSRATGDVPSENSIPTLILFDSLDARVHETEFKRKDLLYLEYATIRLDGKTECVTARKIETDIKKLFTEWPDWPTEYKKGIDWDIEAVRQGDHVMITLANKFQVVKTVIALQYIARWTYLSITGENCFISDVQIESKAAPANEGLIPRIAPEISYINGPEGDVPNVQINGWRTAASEAFPVKDGMKITFHSQSFDTARLIWHCPFVSLFYSDDKKVRGKNFHEFVLVRLDGETWDSDANATNTIVINKSDRFEGWNEWKEANRRGIDCTVSLRRAGRKITLVTENSGIFIRSDTVLKEDFPEVYVALTGDQCALTNIRLSK